MLQKRFFFRQGFLTRKLFRKRLRALAALLTPGTRRRDQLILRRKAAFLRKRFGFRRVLLLPRFELASVHHRNQLDVQKVRADHADHNAEQNRRDRNKSHVAGVVDNRVFARGNQRYAVRGSAQAQAAGIAEESVRAARFGLKEQIAAIRQIRNQRFHAGECKRVVHNRIIRRQQNESFNIGARQAAIENAAVVFAGFQEFGGRVFKCVKHPFKPFLRPRRGADARRVGGCNQRSFRIGNVDLADGELRTERRERVSCQQGIVVFQKTRHCACFAQKRSLFSGDDRIGGGLRSRYPRKRRVHQLRQIVLSTRFFPRGERYKSRYQTQEQYPRNHGYQPLP